MSDVVLTGRLICASDAEADLVERLLPEHIQLTRAEPGCRTFHVRRRADSLVWEVEERFTSVESFGAHQERVAMSEWGRETAAIERDYTIIGATR